MIVSQVFAYLDPGTGSAIIQALVGGVAATGFFFRHHVRVFFHKLLNRISDDDTK